MPGLAGAGASPDKELAVVAQLVEELEAVGQLPLEKLLGVVEETPGLRRVCARAETFQDLLPVAWRNRKANPVAEDPQPDLREPVREVVLEHQHRALDALHHILFHRSILAGNAERFRHPCRQPLVLDDSDHRRPLVHELIDRVVLFALPAACRAEPTGERVLYLKHQHPSRRADHQEVTLAIHPALVGVVEPPQHRPLVVEFPLLLRHPHLGRVGVFLGTLNDPLRHDSGRIKEASRLGEGGSVRVFLEPQEAEKFRFHESTL